MNVRRMATILTAAALAACATNPATGKKELSLMSEAQEIQLGQQADPEVKREMGVYNESSLQEYVRSVGLKLAAVSERTNLPWHFTVVDAPAINAFARQRTGSGTCTHVSRAHPARPQRVRPRGTRARERVRRSPARLPADDPVVPPPLARGG